MFRPEPEIDAGQQRGFLGVGVRRAVVADAGLLVEHLRQPDLGAAVPCVERGPELLHGVRAPGRDAVQQGDGPGELVDNPMTESHSGAWFYEIDLHQPSRVEVVDQLAHIAHDCGVPTHRLPETISIQRRQMRADGIEALGHGRGGR